MPLPEALSRTDWELLRQQKSTLFDLARSARTTALESQHLEGILNFLDQVQDAAQAAGLIPDDPHPKAIATNYIAPGRWTA